MAERDIPGERWTIHVTHDGYLDEEQQPGRFVEVVPEAALSACQEELARCKVHAERADEARHAADHGRASEFKRAQAAEAARDELARAMREMVDRCRAALEPK